MKRKFQILLALLAMAALVAVSGLAWQAAGSQPPHPAAGLRQSAQFMQLPLAFAEKLCFNSTVME